MLCTAKIMFKSRFFTYLPMSTYVFTECRNSSAPLYSDLYQMFFYALYANFGYSTFMNKKRRGRKIINHHIAGQVNPILVSLICNMKD